MSWIALQAEILEEFDEAVMLGGSWTHEAQIESWESRNMREPRALPPLPPRSVYAIAPLAVESTPCPKCGAPCERRTGTKQLVHLGRHCGK